MRSTGSLKKSPCVLKLVSVILLRTITKSMVSFLASSTLPGGGPGKELGASEEALEVSSGTLQGFLELLCRLAGLGRPHGAEGPQLLAVVAQGKEAPGSLAGGEYPVHLLQGLVPEVVSLHER